MAVFKLIDNKEKYDESGNESDDDKSNIDDPVSLKKPMVTLTPLRHILRKTKLIKKKKKYNMRKHSKSTSKDPNITKKRAMIIENLQTVLLYSNASLIKCKDLDGYHCVLCPDKYTDSVDLKKHFLDEHSNPKDIDTYPKKYFLFERSAKLDVSFLNCSICDTDFNKLEELMVHLQTAHEKQIHKDVKNIMLPFRFEKAGFHCAVCEYQFGHFKPLVAHMHSHYRNYVCDKCDAGFVSEFTMVAHLTRHDKFCVCLKCNKSFSSSQYLASHVRRVHERVKEIKCNLCPERFHDFQQKLRHLEEAHGIAQEKVSCEICDKKFESRKNLKRHIQQCHFMDYKFQCEYCAKKFFSSAPMKQHTMTHVDAPRVFDCVVCLKAFKQKKTLMTHMRVHREMMKHKCDLCDKVFLGEVGLNYHLKKSHYQLGEYPDNDLNLETD